MLQIATSSDELYQIEFYFLQVTAVIEGFNFKQTGNGCNIILSTWVLFDSQLTVSVFKNRELVSNIQRSDTELRVYSNGGTQISREICMVKNFGDVWFNANSLANILSMAEVRKVCCITMDMSYKAAMNVHHLDRSIMMFLEYETGLYYYNTGAPLDNPKSTSSNSQAYLFLNSVANNENMYTQCDIE
jgi:hypothetical protein